MTIFVQRIILALLAVTAAVVGPWASFAPRSFYDDFPGFGRIWISVDGPFNEHLIRDVGSFYTALAVMSVIAIARPLAIVVTTAGAAWLTFGTLHLAYHMAHLDVYGTTDQVLNVIALGGSVVLSALLILPRSDRKARV
jgi:hypothetical protein